MEDLKVSTLPFSDLKQNALLGYLLFNEDFYRLVSQKIKPTWFISSKNSKICKLFLQYNQEYGYPRTILEFKCYKEITALEPKERLELLAFIDRNLNDAQQIKLDVLKTELTEWLHSTILLTAMKEASSAFNQQEISRCHKTLMMAVRDVANTTFDKGQYVPFKDYKSIVSKSISDRNNALSTGLTVLDEAILKGQVNGGLLRSETTIIMAPVNQGKTSHMITVACHNIKCGKDVLFMTHEGNPQDIRLKIMSCMLGCTIPNIFQFYQTKDGLEKIDSISTLLDKHLKYIPYNKPGMTIEDVVPIIRSNQDDWASNHKGKGFDLLMSDYPAILTSEIAKKGNLQRRNIDKLIYDQYIQMAIEFDLHSYLAIQTNRDGSKINRGLTGNRERLLTLEDVQESWGPIEEATNVITLNCSPEARKNDLIIYHVGKTRGNTVGYSVMAKSNFAHCITHSNTQGSVGYFSTKPAERLWGVMTKDFLNQIVPDYTVRQMGL